MFSDNTPNFMVFSDPPEMEKKIPIVQKKHSYGDKPTPLWHHKGLWHLIYLL